MIQVQVNHPAQDEHIPATTISQYEEGPIPHKSVIKLAVLDVFANFCVTVGFAIVGSGVRTPSEIQDRKYILMQAVHLDVPSYL